MNKVNTKICTTNLLALRRRDQPPATTRTKKAGLFFGSLIVYTCPDPLYYHLQRGLRLAMDTKLQRNSDRRTKQKSQKRCSSTFFALLLRKAVYQNLGTRIIYRMLILCNALHKIDDRNIHLAYRNCTSVAGFDGVAQFGICQRSKS